MKIRYDSEVDALYIKLLEGDHQCRTLRLSDEVALDIGEGEKLVGIEILDATEILGDGKVPSVILEGLKSSVAGEQLMVREKPAEGYTV